MTRFAFEGVFCYVNLSETGAGVEKPFKKG